MTYLWVRQARLSLPVGLLALRSIRGDLPRDSTVQSRPGFVLPCSEPLVLHCYPGHTCPPEKFWDGEDVDCFLGQRRVNSPSRMTRAPSRVQCSPENRGGDGLLKAKSAGGVGCNWRLGIVHVGARPLQGGSVQTSARHPILAVACTLRLHCTPETLTLRSEASLFASH